MTPQPIWLPIDSAPKDKPIVGFCGDPDVFLNMITGDVSLVYWNEDNWCDCFTHSRNIEVTHWVPLPDPPMLYWGEEAQLRKVKENGLNLKYCHEPSLAVCLEAVREDGLAIEFVPPELRTVAMIEHAVSHRPSAIRYITPFSLKASKIAVQKDARAFANIQFDEDFQREDFQLWCVEFAPRCIYYMKDASLELKVLAINKDETLINCLTEDDLSQIEFVIKPSVDDKETKDDN